MSYHRMFSLEKTNLVIPKPGGGGGGIMISSSASAFFHGCFLGASGFSDSASIFVSHLFPRGFETMWNSYMHSLPFNFEEETTPVFLEPRPKGPKRSGPFDFWSWQFCHSPRFPAAGQVGHILALLTHLSAQQKAIKGPWQRKENHKSSDEALTRLSVTNLLDRLLIGISCQHQSGFFPFCTSPSFRFHFRHHHSPVETLSKKGNATSVAKRRYSRRPSTCAGGRKAHSFPTECCCGTRPWASCQWSECLRYFLRARTPSVDFWHTQEPFHAHWGAANSIRISAVASTAHEQQVDGASDWFGGESRPWTQSAGGEESPGTER